MAELGIGDVARLTNTNPSTLRLWERHGLIRPARSASGQRVYSPEDIQTIRSILRMRKEDGLNMSAIKRALLPSMESPQQASASLDQAQHDELTARLGERFRKARLKRKMPLKEAANLTQLSASFISTFERTGLGATVTSLQKMASAYGTTVTELAQLSEHPSSMNPFVVRRGQARPGPRFGPGIQVFELAERLNTLDCQRWVLEAGAGSDGYYSHEGEEFIHVLEGRFSISIEGGEMHQLEAGDSISFDSRLPHTWRASGTAPTILIWVNTPKSY
ncbi:MAG: MerR family transcriptional regulator [Alcaligenaceae bacterium]|nr:MerR family transcriptional regulator [Alcaligenaceae bacterium]